jgi:CheY-like chemotaxis protein
MSGTDGREIVYYLRKEVLKKHLPIIMISALPNAEKTAKKAGADVFLAKPFEVKTLLQTVEKLLKK